MSIIDIATWIGEDDQCRSCTAKTVAPPNPQSLGATKDEIVARYLDHAVPGAWRLGFESTLEAECVS